MVSIDDEPLAVLDGMSQTATLCGGFAEDAVVKAYLEGDFGSTLIASSDTALGESVEASDYATVLRHLVPGLPHVTFANSGAEAVEKALALSLANCTKDGATKVLAFEGGFQRAYAFGTVGNLQSEKSAWPMKSLDTRARLQPFPVWSTPSEEEPLAPSGFYAAAGHGQIDELRDRFGDADEDPVACRRSCLVGRLRSSAEWWRVFRNPHRANAFGRRRSYGTARFFRALRLLTRHHGVPLIFDEVQTGFALGGPFAWHSQLRLVNFRGQPDYPGCGDVR